MRATVISNWVKVNTPLEGCLPYPYLDSLGYMTTGMGNLIEPLAAMQSYPWHNPDGSPTSASDVAAVYEALDSTRTDPKGQVQTGGPAAHYGQAFANLSTIRLSPAGIQQAVTDTLNRNEAMLRTYFPGWDTFPADGQAAIMSMAWAMGPGFPRTFTSFTAKVNAGDWSGAIADADFRGNGVAARIAMNKQMLANAAAVAGGVGDPETLYWPAAPSGGGMWHKSLLVLALGAGLGAAYRPDFVERLWTAAKGWLSS